jgi:hypothetical protein
MRTRAPTKQPIDELRGIGAPTDLVEFIRGFPAESAVRQAWVEARRADWILYLAVLRGINHDTILRAACACALESAQRRLATDTAEAMRVMVALRNGSERGRDALMGIEIALDDLRLAMLDSAASAPWMVWAKLVFELARASGRGNPLVGTALAMKMLATATPDRAGRPGHLDVASRLRDRLTLAGS